MNRCQGLDAAGDEEDAVYLLKKKRSGRAADREAGTEGDPREFSRAQVNFPRADANLGRRARKSATSQPLILQVLPVGL